EDLAASARPWLLFAGLPLAVGAAIYTAFLFGQAEGRDLWQSTLLPFHLIVQAGMMGAGTVLVLGAFVDLEPALATLAVRTFAVFLGLDLLMLLLGELGMPHASEVAARAAHEITRGHYKNHFWGGAIVLGHLIPAGLLFQDSPLMAAAAGLSAAVGLYFYEHAFVMAPQEVPNS
ncbi:MAG TPA: NrfD/PsrC family molybdoenzyme membrane anchor subunit, partial [Polyangiaceae bacterium LLY-WYZ-15_(1-7)]|nr:NrfD/PsrC family molybdoenzyme membrane anchor subunit [Polyangiaceae bacterium LLY-WYZ-15_(1-7)]